MPGDFYRGGNSLKVNPNDVRYDPGTGFLKLSHGVSVWDRPDGLDRFGGAYRVGNMPENLRVIQRGRDPHHHEVVPNESMSLDEYQEALDQIVLIPI